MKNILIYNSGGGLGDSIQLINLILSLKNHNKRSKMYYLGAHTNHFLGRLKEYGIRIETLDLNLKYEGETVFEDTNLKKDLKKKIYLNSI